MKLKNLVIISLAAFLVIGCGQKDDPKDNKIDELQQKIDELKKDNSRLTTELKDAKSEIATLNRTVGEGKSHFANEDAQQALAAEKKAIEEINKVKSFSYIIIFLILAIALVALVVVIRKKDKQTESKLSNLNNELAKNKENTSKEILEKEKIISQLEHSIKNLERELQSSEINEIAGLIKSKTKKRESHSKEV